MFVGVLGLCACGRAEPVRESTTSPETIRIGLTDFSQADIQIIEEEFDVSLSAPVKVESLFYFWDAGRGPTFSLELTGISYEDFMEHRVHFTYDGYGIDKHGEHVWIERTLEGIRLEKEVINTPECMALLGITHVYRNDGSGRIPSAAAPPSTIPTTISADHTGVHP